MAEPQIITQKESKPLVAEKDECAVNLNIWLAEFEALQMRNFYSEEAFKEFYVNFRRLVTITQHEKDLKEIMYGKVPLIELINHYFKSDVRNNYNLGIKLARAYLTALFTKGLISSR